MNVDHFDSDLGDVAITDSHIERERTEHERWDMINENFSADELIDKIHFSKIQGIEFQPQSMLPDIRIETEDGVKRMFFVQGDPAEEVYRRLKYRYNVYKQIYE